MRKQFRTGATPSSLYSRLAMERADHILVVDDDPEIRALLARYLEKAGLRVSIAANGKEMRARLSAQEVDLIVLDLMLPGEDGLTFCRDLRADGGAAPILMLTARNEEADRIVGLEMGADDYLTKPFAPRELLARIRAILRRSRMLPDQTRRGQATQRLSFGSWVLDTTARHLLDATGTMVPLSGAEYRLLRVFVDHPERVLSRDQLLHLTQGRESDAFDRSIDILVSRLRKRLREDCHSISIIRTVRNEGYVFAGVVKAEDRES